MEMTHIEERWMGPLSVLAWEGNRNHCQDAAVVNLDMPKLLKQTPRRVCDGVYREDALLVRLTRMWQHHPIVWW